MNCFVNNFTHQTKLYFWLLSCLCCLASCEELIEIDLNEANPKLVVDGFIYDTQGPQKIRLSLSTSYFDTAKAPSIENALVTITENDSLIDTLLLKRPGLFETQKINKGKIGATYKLKIIYEGKTYEAASTLLPVANIDSLKSVFKEQSPEDDEGYYVRIFFQDPSTFGNYYLWKLYRNNKEKEGKDELYASDELYNGNYISFDFGKGFELNDTVRVEMFSTDKIGYNYFNQLDEIDNSGDLFDTPPGNVKGNVTNGALGYFGTSQKVKKEIIMQ